MPPNRAVVIHQDCITLLPTTQVFYPKTRKGLWGRVEWGHWLCQFSWLANGRFVCVCLCLCSWCDTVSACSEAWHLIWPKWTCHHSAEHHGVCVHMCACACVRACAQCQMSWLISWAVRRLEPPDVVYLRHPFLLGYEEGCWALGGCVTCSRIWTRVNLSLSVERNLLHNFAQ